MTPGSPYPTSTNAGAHVRWPAARFYWSILDTSNLPNRRPNTVQLGYLLEDVLPVPIDDVHAVYLPLSDDRSLACGVAREALAENQLHQALTLTPHSLPSYIEDGASGRLPDPAAINLLFGPHEPAPVKRLRRRAGALLAMAMAVVLTLIFFGMERRRAAVIDSIDQIKAEQDAVLGSVIPPEQRRAFAGPPALQLTAELRRLRQTRSAHTPDDAHVDITPIIVAMFTAWPSNVHLQTESITVDSQRILLVGRVPSMNDASKVNEQLDSVIGWTIDAPDANKRSDHTAISVSLKPLTTAANPAVDGAPTP